MQKSAIRTARSEDYPQVERIMQQVHRLHTHWRPDIYRDCEPVLPRDAFQSAVETQNLIVAAFGDTVVGFMMFLLRHIESDKQCPRTVLFIDVIAVEEAYRGNGIGHQLLNFAREVARQRQCDGIELQVNARNERAIEMYKRYGFSEKSINMELL